MRTGGNWVVMVASERLKKILGGANFYLVLACRVLAGREPTSQLTIERILAVSDR